MAKVVKKKAIVPKKKKKPMKASIPKKITKVKTKSKAMPKTKTITKKKKKSAGGKIEKKPLTVEERKTKIQDDLLNIAKRYERMKLYDDAIKYYKKLGMQEDIDRLMDTKEDIYLQKAQEFEEQQQYEDALRLYENLKRTEDVERLNRLLGRSDELEEPGDEQGISKPESTPPLQTAPEPGPEAPPPMTLEPITSKDQIPDDASAKLDQPEESQTESAAPDEEALQRENLTHDQQVYPDTASEPELPESQEKIPLQEQLTQELIPPEPPKSEDEVSPMYAQKVFKICPYCGEELNLPKKPNYCPYCKERLV